MGVSLRSISKKIKSEVSFYRYVLRDPRTPLISKILLWMALGYLFLPFDIIPDWIPVLGYVDDLIIVPGLILAAMLFVPKQVVADCRARVNAPN